MSVINFHTKEISVKLVYYGPGLCGKTTSLQTVYASLPQERRPQLVSLATEVDRTIFFDFLPVVAYRIRDYRVRLQLYTVPGQVFYNATRKLVLNGVDGIVFVVDSQTAMKDSNLESLQNLTENLQDLGLDPEQVPTIMQFNKRDLKDIYSIEEMDSVYNPRRLPVFATVAKSGEGLFEALRAISQMVVNQLLRKGLGKQLGVEPQASRPAPVSSDSIGAAMAAASQSQDASVPPSPRPTAASSAAAPSAELWPDSAPTELTAAVDDALRTGRYPEATLALENLMRREAEAWSQLAGQAGGGDPLASYLLTRGIAAGRYRGFIEAVAAAHGGRPVERSQAMNALVVALEALW